MKTPTPMTPFDEATASGLRMLKLFLPLFPPATQSMLAVFIKFIELQNVLHHQAPVSYDALSACDFSSGRGIENLFQDNADSIFDHLSPYLTSEEKQLFSTFKNIKEMMSMADMFTQFFSSAPPSDEEPEDTINNNSPKGDLNNGKLDEPSCNENDRSAQAELIRTAAKQTKGKSGNELAPVMLALITNANRQGLRFNPDEVSLILEVLKEGKSKEEQNQIDRMMEMTKNIFRKHFK